MVNMFSMRKWSALLFVGLFTVIAFFIGLQYYGFIWAMVCMMAGLITSVLVANALITNPFTQMVEGKGVLVMDMNSTGIIRMSIVSLKSPYIVGKMGKEKFMDTWDREAVIPIEPPVIRKTDDTVTVITEGPRKGGLKFEIGPQEYNKARFQLYHYPCLIYNDQVKSLLTKDFFSDGEKHTFAEHGILYLNRRMEQLTESVRDFGRYVVETATRPKTSIWGNKWTWIIIIGVLGLLAAMFAPSIINAIKGGQGAVEAGVQGAQTAAITPR